MIDGLEAAAAAMPAVYLTAYYSLMEVMRIRRGDDILIQAVAGGVGTASLQIAKHIIDKAERLAS